MMTLPSNALISPLVAAAWCLAQAGDAAGGRPEVPIALQYLPLLAIAAAAYLLLFRPERERMKKQQELLGGLKKNDRVVTSSGIYGTVANVERDADRVTLKVDDASNVKIVVTLSSVARVLRDGDAGGGAGDGGGGS
ncbi:MAG: preprotein translocase subunit YajC [Planctomycetia bacterium]|nr:preprotein translocase subunit YajC [Planctomycetia bacterium]